MGDTPNWASTWGIAMILALGCSPSNEPEDVFSLAGVDLDARVIADLSSTPASDADVDDARSRDGRISDEMDVAGFGADSAVDPCDWGAGPVERRLNAPLESVVTLDLDAACERLPGAEYVWRVTGQPERSVSIPLERFFNAGVPQNGGDLDDRRTSRALLYLDRPGQWEVELRIVDSSGAEHVAKRTSIWAGEFGALRFEVVAVADRNDPDPVYVPVLVHPQGNWLQAPLCCWSQNPEPNWGDAMRVDDNPTSEQLSWQTHRIVLPNLERTDILGAPYQLGVYRIAGPERPTSADVTISVSSVVLYQSSQRLTEAENFWVVGELHWRGEASGRFRLVDEVQSRP